MEPLGIINIGIFSPVGLDAAQTSASIRAGVHGTREHAMVGGLRRPIVMGHMPEDVLPPLIAQVDAPEAELPPLQRRLMQLATPALHEVLAAQVVEGATPGRREPRYPSPLLPPGLDALPPLLLAGPEPAPGQEEQITYPFLNRLVLQAGVSVDPSSSRGFETGHAGFFAALRYAQTDVFEAGRAELAVVGGVDSYLDGARIESLHQEGRLRTRGPQDAFTPGEAAAFCLVAPRQVCRRRNLEPIAWIDGVGVAQEPGHRYSQEPHRGDGLADAIAQVFGPPPSSFPPVSRVMAGLTGERLPAKEWGVAYLRNREHFAEALRIDHSAEYTGNAGAALAPLMLGVATSALRTATAGPTLVWASSDRGQRGALLVQAA